jgi:hypothetical protein
MSFVIYVTTFTGVSNFTLTLLPPVHNIRASNNLPADIPFFTMCDSSWNDDVDHGRSTGCFLIFYMGGIIYHSSNLPDPIALSSAEAEYNQACLAVMATTHVNMISEDLTQQSSSSPHPPIPIFMDSQSGIAIGSSFKDTKHTRHILRRYHYVCDAFQTNRFHPYWIPAEFELADIGTKNSQGLVTRFYVPFALLLFQTAQPKRGDRISVSLYFEISNFQNIFDTPIF